MARGNHEVNLDNSRLKDDHVVNPMSHSVYSASDYSVWLELLKRCINTGYDNGVTRSLFNATYTFQIPQRKRSDIPQSINDACVSYMQHYIDVVVNKQQGYRETGLAEYDYSERIRDGLPLIVAKLRNKRNSKSSVVNVASADDFQLENPPCLTELQFRILGDDTLLTMFTFRSHDLYKGFLPNMKGIQVSAAHLASQIFPASTPVKFLYSGVSKDLHIYEQDLSDATIMALKARLVMEYPFVSNGCLQEALPGTEQPVDVTEFPEFFPQVNHSHAEYLKNV